MYDLILITCLLTLFAPYYDCSNEIYIFIDYDNRFITYEGAKSKHILGFTKHNDPQENSTSIYLGNDYNYIDNGSDDKKPYWTVLMHELEHVRCNCNWHGQVIATITITGNNTK